MHNVNPTIHVWSLMRVRHLVLVPGRRVNPCVNENILIWQQADKISNWWRQTLIIMKSNSSPGRQLLTRFLMTVRHANSDDEWWWWSTMIRDEWWSKMEHSGRYSDDVAIGSHRVWILHPWRNWWNAKTTGQQKWMDEWINESMNDIIQPCTMSWQSISSGFTCSNCITTKKTLTMQSVRTPTKQAKPAVCKPYLAFTFWKLNKRIGGFVKKGYPQIIRSSFIFVIITNKPL